MTTLNRLHYGDNLDVLRESVADGAVDLVYLDPPFNSKRAFNVFFGKAGEPASAQIQAFDDTWHWSPEIEDDYRRFVEFGEDMPFKVAEALAAFRSLLRETDMMAYLVTMAPRLVELRRVLKPNGCLYLHCDPTASHYLKLLLDAIFGIGSFVNEIVWKRFSAKNDPHRYGRSHDVILLYARGPKFKWHKQFGPFEPDYVEQNYRYVEAETGRRYRRDNLTAAKPGGDVDYEWHGARPYKNRHWAYSRANLDRMLTEGRIEFRSTGMPVFKRYLDEQPGVPLQDVWTDIRLHAGSGERLGYPTQKPLALLERIITASSDPDDVVLDPFCGCGTTIDAAVRLDRRWVGIDVAYYAVNLIRERLAETFGPSIANTYTVHGIPRDLGGAEELANRPFEFERWAVSLIRAEPNERQVGDKGYDGMIRFHHSSGRGPADGRVLVSVKSGKQLNPSMIQALDGALRTHKAQMGVFISLREPTKGMRDIALRAGQYEWPMNGDRYHRIQVFSIAQLLKGEHPRMPPRVSYLRVASRATADDQMTFDDELPGPSPDVVGHR